jgi:hypothetical protein
MNQDNKTPISTSTKDALSTAIAELNKQILTKETEIETLKKEKKSIAEFYEAKTGVRFKTTGTTAVSDDGVIRTKRAYKKRKKSNNPKKEAALSGPKVKGPKANREVLGSSRVVKPTKVPSEIVAQFGEGKGARAKICWALQQLGGKATRDELKIFLSKDLVGNPFTDNLYWAVSQKDITKSKDGETLHLQRWDY